MADVTIKYKGQSIATMDASGTKTLGTQGKYCEGDIGVEYVKPAGPTGTKSISITQNGTTTEDVAAYANAEITVNVQGGGDAKAATIIQRTATTIENSEATSVGLSAFRDYRTLISCILPNVTAVGGSAFYNCANLEVFEAVLHPSIATYAFYGCAKLRSPIVDGVLHSYDGNEFAGCKLLTIVDLKTGLFRSGTFGNCSAFNTLIIRETGKASGVATLANVNVFNGTPFASGGSGGTIYIPKSAYEHLGDGTASDYKAATNWSTIDGYGTITWAQIEGSIYETQYADGTPVT